MRTAKSTAGVAQTIVQKDHSQKNQECLCQSPFWSVEWTAEKHAEIGFHSGKFVSCVQIAMKIVNENFAQKANEKAIAPLQSIALHRFCIGFVSDGLR